MLLLAARLLIGTVAGGRLAWAWRWPAQGSARGRPDRLPRYDATQLLALLEPIAPIGWLGVRAALQ